MEKSKLARFIDNFVLFFSILIIIFIILRTKFTNNFLCLSVALLFSFLLFLLILHLQNRRYRKLSIKNSEKQSIIDCNFALRKISQASQQTFFKNMLKNHKIKSNSHGLIIEGKILLYIALNLDEILPENIFSIYSKAKNIQSDNIEEICLICNKVNENVNSIISSFDIRFTIFTPTETYSMMKQFNYFPSVPEKPPKIKVKFFKAAFMKNKGKTFIKCAFCLYIFSLFVPFTKYYIITASILLIFGVICLCFGKKNKQIIQSLSKEILLKNN